MLNQSPADMPEDSVERPALTLLLQDPIEVDNEIWRLGGCGSDLFEFVPLPPARGLDRYDPPIFRPISRIIVPPRIGRVDSGSLDL